MTLLDTINNLLDIARKQPNINHVGNGDVYSLNSLPNINYGVFFITQQNHSINDDITTYNLTLYYIDRLLSDNSNTLQIQSQGIMILANIINIFNNSNLDADIEYDINFTTFTHRFQDDCGGVFANVRITTNNGLGTCSYE